MRRHILPSKIGIKKPRPNQNRCLERFRELFSAKNLSGTPHFLPFVKQTTQSRRKGTPCPEKGPSSTKATCPSMYGTNCPKNGRSLVGITNFAVGLVNTGGVDITWTPKPLREVIVNEPNVRVGQVLLLPFDNYVGRLDIRLVLREKNWAHRPYHQTIFFLNTFEKREKSDKSLANCSVYQLKLTSHCVLIHPKSKQSKNADWFSREFAYL